MSEWISVKDRLPEGFCCLAFYKNGNGKSRIIKARYVKKFTEESGEYDELDQEYDESTDTYYWPEGWYEEIDNWDDFTSVVVYQGEITHWMNLPEPPEGEK